MKEKGKLFIVPTPIGNLDDMTFRAVETLKKADIIAAEDTRNSGKLLKHFEITTSMISYHKYNESQRAEEFLELFHKGKNIAVISDAGSPGISDPAFQLIRTAIDNNIQIEALPGATALIPAFILSGFPTENFIFIGFLPKKKKEKEKLCAQFKELTFPLIFYEAPHRIIKSLQFLGKYFGDREIVIARELTKLHEEIIRTTLMEFLSSPEKITLKGEFVIVMNGAKKKQLTDDELKQKIIFYLKKGESKATTVQKVMQETGAAKNRIYDLAIKL